MLQFIDLFAGLGGFHKALKELGHECVFASEIDPKLQDLYYRNWGIMPEGNIKEIVEKRIGSIPKHGILCAGFPCQPFSKAGKQEGRADLDRGTLFDEIVKVLESRKPRYFILENVPFIAQHDNEETWKYMKSQLERVGYKVDHRNYSPHDFGIPQHRLRIFIVGSRVGLSHFNFDEIDKLKKPLMSITDFLLKKPKSARALPSENLACIRIWQEFINSLPKESELPGFPIWAMEFGATYPFEESFPHGLSAKQLGRYKGNFGCNLDGYAKDEQLKRLPSYARTEAEFPEWKKNFIKQNRDFYSRNKKFVGNAVKKIAKFEFQSWQKLEWNVGREKGRILDNLIQFRASGVRVKRADFFPSLVCTQTQVPIVGWEGRYLSKQECLGLQSLDGIELPEIYNAAFRALGNAVNATIVKMIAKRLVRIEDNGLEKRKHHKSKVIAKHETA